MNKEEMFKREAGLIEAALENSGVGENIAHPRLSEAELANVSGGVSDAAIKKAKTVCKDCQYRMIKICMDGEEKLAKYMQKNGTVGRWIDCPFRPR